MTERHGAIVSILLCVLFWGFSFVSIKEAVAVFPPMTLGAVRFALALILLALIKRRLVPAEKPAPGDLPWLLGSGFTGVTLYFFCENNGVALVSASEASIIVGSIPVLAVAAEWARDCVFRRRTGAAAGRSGIWRWMGALLSAAGVILAAGFSLTGAGGKMGLSFSGNIPGCLYMTGAAVSWTAYCFLTEPLFARHSRIFIVFWQNLFGFLGFLPFTVPEYPRWGRPDLPVLLHTAFLGICCSALAYYLYARSLDILGAGVSGVFINLVPVVTVTAGFFLLGDRLNPLQWAGAALVISGVYLVMLERPRRPGRAKP
ncbi:MAG: DMT family transporter [Treponema sp.]|nr:DMT family transporter [Treponema sp.]